MNPRIHWVDAFATQSFTGNPAAVVLLEHDADEAWMQDLARELGISETAFVRVDAPDAEGAFPLRWFTPTVEVDLCGHATLASAQVAFETGIVSDVITFTTRSGPLTCTRRGDLIALDLPSAPSTPIDAPPGLLDALGIDAATVSVAAKWLLVEVDAPAAVEALQPDIDALARVGDGCVIVTARGDGDPADIVSRVFAPGSGIPEDPVTGSAHCVLVPYWSPRLGRPDLLARQASARSGILHCRDLGSRVEIAGRAVTVLRGTLDAP
jgi:predicted PhzF superfamily epimerase YddE/YHI9